MKHKLPAIALSAVLALSGTVAAAEVEARIQSASVSFSGGQAYTNGKLVITGPNGFQKEETALRGLPTFRTQTAGRLVDGFYNFSVSAATDEVIPVQNTMNNGRGADARKTEYKPFSMFGAFRVEKGVILPVEKAGGADGDGTE